MISRVLPFSQAANEGIRKIRLAACLALMAAPGVMLSGCADYTSPQSALDESADIDQDPWEGFNRAMFKVNTALDKVIVRPVASAYRFVLPDPVEHGVSNALMNLRAPIDLTNSVLQGDAQNSFAVLWRFVLNTTFGGLGVYDFAGKQADLHARQADFGQTLAVYGVNSGPFLFLPVLGPSTLRDTGGRAADLAFDPLTYAGGDYAWVPYARAGVAVVDFRAQNMKLIDDVYKNSLDPYATFRSGYLQRRIAEIKAAREKNNVEPVAASTTTPDAPTAPAIGAPVQ